MSKSEYKIVLSNLSKKESAKIDKKLAPPTKWEQFKGGVQSVAKVYHSATLARQAFSTVKTYIYRNVDNSNLTDRIDAGLTIAQQGLGVVLTGIAAGPVGAVTAAGTVALSYLGQLGEFGYNRRWENYELAETRRLMGPDFNRSRRE